MAHKLELEVHRFAKEYATLFSSPDCSNANIVAEHAKQISQCYRSGFTVFTNGDIARYEVWWTASLLFAPQLTRSQTQREAAQLIETEMRNNIATSTGTNLELLAIGRIEIYSQTFALCWIKWCFHPAAGSPFAGNDWTFTNVYGYRAAADGKENGWELVIRDEEVNAMVRATGSSFLS